MIKKMTWLPILILSAGLMSSCGSNENKETTTESTPEQVAVINTTHAYICPMNCENSASMEPGLCKVCGMDLVKNPNYQGTLTDSAAVSGAATTDDDTVKVEPGHEGHNH